MSSLITMQAPCSLVNCGLNEKPRAEKNAFERSMFRIGRLTKILRAIGWLLVVRLVGFRACRARGSARLRGGPSARSAPVHRADAPRSRRAGPRPSDWE